MLHRLGVIGAGSTALAMLETLVVRLPVPLEHLSVLVNDQSREPAEVMLERIGSKVAQLNVLRDSVDAMIADRLDVVAECAGPDAVRDYGAIVLASATDLVVVSVGALADDALRRVLEQSALRSGAQLVLPPGAIGGIDALVAARLAGLDAVTYVGRRPPLFWRGTAAEQLLDLEAVNESVIFYKGSARDAARDYPQNANVAATVALAGAGFDKTKVHLVADPSIKREMHEVEVRSACADFTIRLESRPLPDNPNMSMAAAFSVARTLLNRLATVEI